MIAYGTPITATVKVVAPGGGKPTGVLTWFEDTGSGPAYFTATPLKNGSTTLPPTFATPGDHTYGCGYSADGTSNYSVSYCDQVSFTVTKASTTTSVTSSASSSAQGKTVTFTARVSPQHPGTTATGSVTFTDGSTVLGTATLTKGVAKLATRTLGSGAHTITATYSGDDDFTGSSGSVSQYVS